VERPARQVAEEAIAAWNRGDDPIEVGLVADDVEYVNPPDAVEPGTQRGADGWRQAMRRVNESFDVMGIDLDRVVELDDRCLTLINFRIRGRTSRVEGASEQGMIFTVRDGKIARFEWYSSHEDTLAAAGLADAD
jgi:ketosteroid isomerase-like protein